MGRRITIVSAGHLATCPRMLKAADALHESGYAVRVVSVSHTGWAARADEALRRTRPWPWERVDIRRASAPARWLSTGVPHRAARELARLAGDPSPMVVTAHAFSRVHGALVHAILREPADLLVGGTTGALAAVAEAGRRSGTPFAIDFEDFHCGEGDDSPQGREHNRLADAIMRDVVRDAVFVTAGSAAIARASNERLGAASIPIHNVFPLPAEPPLLERRAPGRARFYWCGQTIGPGRGLEDVVRAVGRLGVGCELHLRGCTVPRYLAALRGLADDCAPALRICVHEPADPGAMVESCRPFSIGLATEPGQTRNSALSLSNKALTYPLAGLPVVLADTEGQHAFGCDLGEGAALYTPGDVEGLAIALDRWLTDPASLDRARQASWSAACRRWPWDHLEERGTLLARVAAAVA
jgi:hypothetical protein